MIEDFNSLGNTWQAKLPSTYWLKQRYSFYRTECFDNQIPPVEEVTIIWDPKLRGPAGKCWKSKKLIKLAPHYFLMYPNNIEDTLRHEMIHLLVPNHGPNFYKWLDILKEKGYPTSRFSNEVAQAKYIYTCPSCGQTWPAAKKYRTQRYCKKCGPQKGLLREEEIFTDEDYE